MMQEQLEEMGSFFDARIDGYEEHMFQCVDGAKEYYRETAALIPVTSGLRLLDLGCGSGLELDEIFVRNPKVWVTGIDLSTEMLALLRKKHGDKGNQLRLIQGSYFDVDYGDAPYDIALSVQTMHHFNHQQKRQLYRKIWAGLKPGGIYIETDYTAPTQEIEEEFFAEYERIKREQCLGEGFYHYDTPCTVENQTRLLLEAGFETVTKHWQHEATTILIASKAR